MTFSGQAVFDEQFRFFETVLTALPSSLIHALRKEDVHRCGQHSQTGMCPHFATWAASNPATPDWRFSPARRGDAVQLSTADDYDLIERSILTLISRQDRFGAGSGFYLLRETPGSEVWQQALLANGFSLASEEPAMSCSASNLRLTLRVQKLNLGGHWTAIGDVAGLDVRFTEVSSTSDVDIFMSVIAAANDFDIDLVRQLKVHQNIHVSSKSSPDTPSNFRRFIVWCGDRAVGTVSSLRSIGAETLGIYDVAVVAEFREKGIGALCVQFPLLPEVCDSQFEVVTLRAANDKVGAQVFSPIGFSVVGMIDVFSRACQSPQPAIALDPASPWLFVSDFDGTLATIDALDFILDHFSVGGLQMRRGIDERVERGEITVLEGLIECYTWPMGPKMSFDAAVAEMERMNGGSIIDPGFLTLARAVRRSGGRVVIVSSGFRKMIEAVLPNDVGWIEIISHDVTVKPHSGEDYEWVVQSNPRAFSKTKVLQELKAMHGSNIVFFGDGLSDIPAAAASDVIFAKESLSFHRYCVGNSIPCIPFNRFQDAFRLFQPSSRVTTLGERRLAVAEQTGVMSFADAVRIAKDADLVYVAVGSFVRSNAAHSRDQQLPAFCDRASVVVLLLDPLFCGQQSVPLAVADSTAWSPIARNAWQRDRVDNHVLLASFSTTVGESSGSRQDRAILAELRELIMSRGEKLTVVAEFCVPYLRVPEAAELCKMLDEVSSLNAIHLQHLHLAAYAKPGYHQTHVWPIQGTFSQDEALCREVARYATRDDLTCTFGMSSYELIPEPGSTWASLKANQLHDEVWRRIDTLGGIGYCLLGEVQLNDAVLFE